MVPDPRSPRRSSNANLINDNFRIRGQPRRLSRAGVPGASSKWTASADVQYWIGRLVQNSFYRMPIKRSRQNEGCIPPVQTFVSYCVAPIRPSVKKKYRLTKFAIGQEEAHIHLAMRMYPTKLFTKADSSNSRHSVIVATAQFPFGPVLALIAGFPVAQTVNLLGSKYN